MVQKMKKKEIYQNLDKVITLAQLTLSFFKLLDTMYNEAKLCAEVIS